MKVLLTGSSGFIGGELKRALVAHGHDVYCLNRKGAGKGTGGDREIVWDFVSLLPDTMPEEIDAVLHMAAKANFGNAQPPWAANSAAPRPNRKVSSRPCKWPRTGI